MLEALSAGATLREGKLQQAQGQLLNARELDPGDSEVTYLLGLTGDAHLSVHAGSLTCCQFDLIGEWLETGRLHGDFIDAWFEVWCGVVARGIGQDRPLCAAELETVRRFGALGELAQGPRRDGPAERAGASLDVSGTEGAYRRCRQ